MSNASTIDADAYESLPPSLRKQIEDAALTFAIVLKDSRGATVGEIRDRIPPKAQTWIRQHAAEFGASVIRHYRRMAAAG